MNGHYSSGEIVFGKWKLERMLGAGSFGKVFEATREDFGSYKSAVKIITIPQSPAEIQEARSEGMDDASITYYFRSVVDEIVREFALLSQFKGTSNIVSYEDHDVIPHEGSVGWDILIRMELLTPLTEYMCASPMSTQDVIRLGVDICKALEFCHRANVIHRDIKPENIFVSKLGDFKLGDFGIARTVEKTGSGLSKKGTYTYMAPEVFREARYDATVDIYSLGIVLYRLLNNNRAPFLPAPPAPIAHSEREAALSRRISGDPIPAPQNADPQLAQVILKACAFHPGDRYQTASQMRADLEALMAGTTGGPAPKAAATDFETENDRTESIWAAPTGAGRRSTTPAFQESTAPSNSKPQDWDRTVSVYSQPQDPDATVSVYPQPAHPEDRTQILTEPAPKSAKKKGLLIGLIVGILAIIAILAVVLLSRPGSGNPGSNSGNNKLSASGKKEVDDLPDSGDLFEAMLWGFYDAKGVYVPKEDEEGASKRDLTAFMESMKYQTLTYGGEELEVSALPFGFYAYTLRHSSDSYGDEYIHYDDPEGMEILKELVLAQYGSEYWVNFNKYLDLNLIDLEMCDRTGYIYRGTFAYRLESNKLILSTIDITDESTFAFTLTDFYSCKMAVEGRNIVLSNKGKKITYLNNWLSGQSGDSLSDVSESGYVYDDAQAYHDIAYIYVRGNPAVDETGFYTSIMFTDGCPAIDPVHIYNDDGTITFRWEQRYVEYNGRWEKVDDPYEFTCEYMLSAGILLKIDGKWYRYQNSFDGYYGKKLQGLDTEDLDEEQVANIIITKDNMLEELNNAFTASGISATIDATTGKVSMDSSILFATGKYDLSAEGKAYLDGFLDTYTAVILSKEYAGYVSEIVIEGHTDTQGTYDYNMELSENRAASVASYCLEQNPELKSVITTKGYSFDHPIYKEDGSVDMAASRRVTFRFVLTLPEA